MKKSLLIGLVMMFAAGFVSGRVSRAAGTTIPATANAIDVTDYERVWQAIKDQHVDGDKLTDAQLFYGAVKGLAAATDDPYTVFVSPEDAQQFNEDMQGSFFGIGAVVEKDRNGNVMARPMEGSPAEKAGMKVGDLIVSVDGVKLTEQMKLTDVVRKLRGEEGKSVKVTVYRPDLKKTVDLVIVRGKVSPAAEAKLKVITSGKKKILLIPLKQFNEDGGKLFKDAVDMAEKSHVDGVILDVRNNPGGYVGVAGDIVCAWKNDQPFVIFENRSEGARPQKCRRFRPTPFSDMPTVVLVNKYSASASEITAGALQDFKKARIIGETTFGKGCAQIIMKFPDHSELKITTELWKTPANRSINKTGVKPDEEVKPLVEAPEEDEPKISGDSKKPKKEPKDVQLDRALEFLTTGH